MLKFFKKIKKWWRVRKYNPNKTDVHIYED